MRVTPPLAVAPLAHGEDMRWDPTERQHLNIETRKFVQEKSKQAMKQVLGIKDEAARLRVTPPLAVAPLAHGEDMRWDPNDDGINFNP